MKTPEFLAWAIEFTCPVRGEQDGSDPARTERQLRAARAASDARRENRVLDGIAVDPPYGFRIADALALYGGESAVATACGSCPANRIGENSELSYAGCYGLTPVASDVIATLEQAIEQTGTGADADDLFPVTSPRWYGLWINSPLSMPQLEVVARLAEAAGLAELAAGCGTSLSAKLPLHARLYPAGKIEGTWWRLVPHCPRCKAAWPVASGRRQPPADVKSVPPPNERGAHAPRSPRCNVCRYVGHPAPDKKRRPRGKRPYTQLENILGSGQSTEFLARYFDRQMSARSPDRE